MPGQKGKIFFKSEGAEKGYTFMYGATKGVLEALSHRFGWPSTPIDKGFPVPEKDLDQVWKIFGKWDIKFDKGEKSDEEKIPVRHEGFEKRGRNLRDVSDHKGPHKKAAR